MSVVHVNSISGITSITTPSSSDVLTLHTSNNAERLRINSSGQLLLNTTDGTGAYQLVVTNPSGSDTGMTFRGATSSQQYIRFADGTSGGAENIGEIEYNHDTNSLAIDVNGSERLRIKSDGYVLIGTSTEGQSGADDLTVATAGGTLDHAGITIRSATNRNGSLFFSDGTSGADEYRGWVQYTHSDGTNSDYLTFGTNASEKLRITSTGKMGLGTGNNDPVGGDFVVENTTGLAGVALSRVFSGNVASSAVNTPSFAFTMSDTATNDQVVASISPQALAGTGDAFKGHIRVFTANDAGTNTERLRITSDGVTAINKNSGSYSGTLHVVKRSGINTAITIEGNPGEIEWRYQDGVAARRGGIQWNASGEVKFDAGISGNSYYYRFDTNGTERFRIDANGSVGIGTDSPGTACDSRPGLHIHSNHNDSCRLNLTTPTKDNTRIGYFGLNRFGIDFVNGFQLRESSASYATRLLIDNNGNMGMGGGGAASFHTASGNTYGGIEFHNEGNDTAACLKLTGNNNSGGSPGQETFTQLSHLGGNLTFNISHNGTDRLVIGSTGVVSGDLNDTSDIALKKDIESISTSCIDNIKQLNPVTFKWKDTSRKDIGFIAQEVEDILPDLVNGEDGVKSINTIGLVAQLTKALQEAIAEIETLKAKVAALKGS